jgi:hypothetical protein
MKDNVFVGYWEDEEEEEEEEELFYWVIDSGCWYNTKVYI